MSTLLRDTSSSPRCVPKSSPAAWRTLEDCRRTVVVLREFSPKSLSRFTESTVRDLVAGLGYATLRKAPASPHTSGAKGIMTSRSHKLVFIGLIVMICAGCGGHQPSPPPKATPTVPTAPKETPTVPTAPKETPTVPTAPKETPTVPVAAPDLIVYRFSIVTKPISLYGLHPGGGFRLWAGVRNAGSGDALATTLRYYRSTDATISTSDTEVGTDAVKALAASGKQTVGGDRRTAPSTVGTYYYGACVDAVAGESSTTNNCSSSSFIEVTTQ